jgi:hypothetical protein
MAAINVLLSLISPTTEPTAEELNAALAAA